MQIRQIVPNGKTWTKKPVVQTLTVSEYRCQSVSITAENDCLGNNYFLKVPVPSTTRLRITLDCKSL